ncbi:hypothetical protein K505DRAFT_299736 [Melanomma pulvis-pyrius CBS 109.77]|uniref:PWI domain-containing protein n=1 Tax=Melanomma pulvis-pyrius CBS 109.77 TaxID=1314802 RepID=A0A6A6XJE4_9PLEO|nr:hypothetical protein K505DRAFT_299736 [Melanomma pulvis-pyrius CBS 109.77]
MYNYAAPPGYSRPPGYGGAPPGMGPPGMGPPPGSSAPGVAAPPGVSFQGPPALGGPRPLPHNWQAPTNMPNINLNAPVIRLGTLSSQRGAGQDGSAGRRESTARPARPGLGMDSNARDGDQGQKGREPSMLIPPTREEIARTIFVGNIPDGVSDEGMERILRAAGSLRRWTRATDANDKTQTFGFAEYDDAQSLETAAEIFKDVHVPTMRQNPGDVHMENGDEEVEKTKLQIMVDDASIKYAEEWSKTRNEDETTVQFRIDTAKETLSQVIGSLFNPPNAPQLVHGGNMVRQDVQMHDSDGVEVAVINLSAAEDELADIPAEMREIVAAEISAFRDRSTRRDLERLRREEELEAEERRRNRMSRASPPPSAPTGPGGVNGVPLGPKADRGIQGAPSGPKGSQFPRDYQTGVNFINGGSINNGVYTKHDDDDDSASDEEIERRHKEQLDAERDDAYKKELSRWLKHESRNAASLERTSGRQKNEEAELQAARDTQATKLKSFDDDAEAAAKRHLYYRDHGDYMRQREKVRERESKDDDVERSQEQRDTAAQQKQKDHAQGQADALHDQQAEEILRNSTPLEPQHFRMSLGAAAKKIEKATAPRRTVAEIENLLENDDALDQPSTKKRALIPINFDAAVRANLTQEEIKEAQQQLALDIPSNKEGLWKWKISWDHLLDKTIDVDIKSWASNKILDTVGVHEDMLVDAIVTHLKNRGGPEALVEELQGALDDDSEPLVIKLWRMVIFFSECEKQGIK